ncbi:MAG: response regulator, partial [Planctomycetales bacterium]|nr:response regulator [Planctomycetales bacterium]
MKSILIVDDDAQLAESLATRCRGIGLTAVTAKNLFTALAILENSRPDLLCVDVHLPTGNGLNMCDLLVADPRVSHIP